jgi:hypothetical protein
MNKPIVMYISKKVGVNHFQTSSYDITFHGRWHWFQRLCWRFLEKTNGVKYHFDEQDIVQQVYIDPDKAVEQIILLAKTQIESVNLKPKMIYMGPKEFSQLCMNQCNLPDYLYYLKFNLNSDRYLDNRNNTPIFCDIPIEVVGHMEGILVV